MHVYGLRLLVALITFGVGVAASWLLGSGRTPTSESRVVVGESVPVLVAAPAAFEPRERSCNASVYGGILNGKATSRPAPRYPAAAKAAGVSGTVVVNIEVDESGAVAKAEAASGPLMLREAAEDAAREARFAPTRLNGRPIKVAGTLTYNFSLQ